MAQAQSKPTTYVSSDPQREKDIQAIIPEGFDPGMALFVIQFLQENRGLDPKDYEIRLSKKGNICFVDRNTGASGIVLDSGTGKAIHTGGLLLGLLNSEAPYKELARDTAKLLSQLDISSYPFCDLVSEMQLAYKERGNCDILTKAKEDSLLSLPPIHIYLSPDGTPTRELEKILGALLTEEPRPNPFFDYTKLYPKITKGLSGQRLTVLTAKECFSS